MKTIKAFLVARLFAAVAFVLSFFDRGLDGILANLTKLDAKLDRFVDKQQAALKKEVANRQAAAEAIFASFERSEQIAQASMRAERVQERVRKLID